MSLYWFAGWLDHSYTLNPIRLRGYDGAGNLLYAVRGNSIRENDFFALRNSTNDMADFVDPYRFAPGVDEWGNARTIATRQGWSGYQTPYSSENIRAIAVDSDGWIYCAMGELTTVHYQLLAGVTVEQIKGVREDAIAAGLTKYHTFWTAAVPNSNPTVYYYRHLLTASDISQYANDYGRIYTDFFRVYRQNGDRIPFPDLHGGPVWAVATDNTYCYLAGEGVGVNREYLRKYNKAGVQQWAAQLPAWVTAKPARYTAPYTVFGVFIPERWQYWDYKVNNILVDGSSNIYLSGYDWYSDNQGGATSETSANGWIRKYNSSGVLQWERRFINMATTNVVTDGTLFYVGLFRDTNQGAALFNTYRIDSTDYFYDVSEPYVEAVAWDADGDVARYALARPNYEYAGWRYLSDDAKAARRLEYHDGRLYMSLAGSSDKPLVIVYDTSDLSATTDNLTREQYSGMRGALGHNHFLFDGDGSRVFSRTERTSPANYTDANSQAINSPIVARHFFRYDDAGAQEWTSRTAHGWAYQADLPSFTYEEAQRPLGWGAFEYGGFDSFVYNGYAADIAIVADPSLPALALPYDLGVVDWEGDRTTPIPGLPLVLALGTPDWRREYVGALRLADVYRLILDGSPPLVFAATSLSLRRTAFSRQLTAVVALPGVENMAVIESRIGENLQLFRGIRFPDGLEQLEPMFAVPLATVRSDRGAQSLSLTLEGRAEEPEAVPLSRALRDISYRNVGANGQRRIRCGIDTYLRPGYTATFGGDSLIVGEITISVSPVSGVMEVLEVAT
jgi:hypothetical protein